MAWHGLAGRAWRKAGAGFISFGNRARNPVDPLRSSYRYEIAEEVWDQPGQSPNPPTLLWWEGEHGSDLIAPEAFLAQMVTVLTNPQLLAGAELVELRPGWKVVDEGCEDVTDVAVMDRALALRSGPLREWAVMGGDVAGAKPSGGAVAGRFGERTAISQADATDLRACVHALVEMWRCLGFVDT